MKSTMRSLLFSVKPRYADLIFRRLKEAELRRRIARCIENRDVFIYVSSPVRQLRGGFRVGQVWRGTPEEVWNEVSELAGVDKQDFDAYYAERTIAYALRVTDVWEYEKPASLITLRNRFGNFVIPQSWRYIKPEEYRSFQKMKKLEFRKPPENCDARADVYAN